MNSRVFACTVVLLLGFSSLDRAYGQNDARIWMEFVGILKAGNMSIDRIRPLEQLGDSYKPILLGFLDSIRVQASPEDWVAQPEIIRAGDRIQFLVPWSARGQKLTYCFSFVEDTVQWYFQHLETIFVRLDKLGSLPASTFPDVTEGQKAWAREETFWSFVVLNVYLPLSADRGKEFALNVLKDGAGYFVGARAWVPFTSPRKAFVLYLCWEQANLRGNRVTLERLEDKEALVRLKTQFFDLYFAAAHLRPMISIEDYKRIFEAIWQDRASNAGWHLEIQYSADYQVIFHLTRKS